MKLLALVLGAAGQLGEAMAGQLGARHEVVACTRADLDVTNASAVRTLASTICPDVIVNCAAYTNVDGAEGAPETALAVNAWAVRTLANVARDIDCALVHFSTDFVFDGTTDALHTEDDVPNPQGVYAVSKLLGEWFAAEAPRHYILRVESLFGGVGAHSSVDKMLDGITSGREVTAFSDRTVSPTFIDDAIAATMALLDGELPFGLYHCVNTGGATWSALARELARIAGRPDATILDIPMAQANLIAPRPKYAALSNAKLAAAGIVMPTWQNAVQRHLAQSQSLER